MFKQTAHSGEIFAGHEMAKLRKKRITAKLCGGFSLFAKI
jgi:hypothetical protein